MYPYFVLAHCPLGVAEGVFVGAAVVGPEEGDAEAMTAGTVEEGPTLAAGVLCGSRSSVNTIRATTATATIARTAVPPVRRGRGV